MRVQAILPTAMVIAAAWGAMAPMTLHDATRLSDSQHLAAERRRLQSHFDSVTQELVGRDTRSLRPDQLTARAQVIHRLREYRDRGVFPLNDGFADQAVPIFRDRRGVLCAMAFLIARSGHQDIVDRIARTNNLALMADLAHDTPIVAWLDSAGLSLAEAGRIQPEYRPPPGTVYKRDAVTAKYAVASILVSGTAIGTVFLDLAKASKARAWSALIAGSAATALGVEHIDRAGTARATVGTANVIVGGTALVVGLHGLLRSGNRPSAGGNANRRHVTVTPSILALRRQPQPGLLLHIGF